MKIKDFIKDKLYFITTFTFIVVFLNVFLYFIDTNKAVMFMVNLAFLILFFTVMLVEFFRRYDYYNNIFKMLDEMEEKYLIFDLIETNDFLDSFVMEEVIKLGNYSMNKKVDKYRISQEEYKDYIELWVHEIKTPLSALKLMVDNNNFKNVKNEIERINYYIEQSLYYARSSSVEKDYLIEEVNLEKSVKSVVRNLSNNFIQKNISVDLDLKANNVFSDSKWLEFIIKQILINSVQYSNENSNVKIISRNSDNAIVLEIIDEGIGIKETDIARVFDLGFTGESGRVYNQATGMGLYLVKKLSQSLHINVEIVSDNGVKVSLIIPKSSSHFKF